MRIASILSAIAAAAVIALLPGTAANAGGKDCNGQCYEEVPAPVIHRTFKRRIELEPGVYEIDREPSLYGLATRRVLLDSGTEWREKSAVYKTVKVRRHVHGKVTWEKRWIDGRYVMCKVHVPGKTVWVEKHVMVSPARRWKLRSHPVYGYEQRRILIKNYKNIAVYHGGRYKYVNERVAIQPESTVWAPISRY